MGEADSRRRLEKVPDEEEEEDSGSDERSDRSRRGLLAKFSTLKVGPPRGTKPATGQTDVGAQRSCARKPWTSRDREHLPGSDFSTNECGNDPREC